MTRARETAKAGNYTEKAFPTGSNVLFRLNDQNLSASVTIPSDKNASVIGPITVDSGVNIRVNGNFTVL